MDLAYQTLAFSPVRRLELWRYFTYSLLHAGLVHLLINVVLQLVIALLLESEVGHLNVVFVYVFGVLSGSLAASVSPDFSLMVGASSGIYSLLLSHVPHIYMVSVFTIKIYSLLNLFSNRISQRFRIELTESCLSLHF